MKSVLYSLALLLSVLPFNLCAAALSIPLHQSGNWQLLEYSGIPAHEVSFSPDGMTVDINGSASPLIYPIAPQVISQLQVDLEVSGDFRLKAGRQGDRGNDDFVFRIGLVFEGDQTLGFFQRSFAAKWIKTLFDLAPEGTGVDRIEFYNVYSDADLAGGARVHPLSELINEQFVVAAPEISTTPSAIKLRIEPGSGKKVLALWISSDGDDTGSSYRVRIKNIILLE